MADQQRSNGNFKCSPKDCEYCQAVFPIVKQDKTQNLPLDPTKVDFGHLYNNHIHLFGEYYEVLAKHQAAEIERLKARVKSLETTNSALTSRQQASKTAPVAELVVDPRNHVDGFCDSLKSYGTEVYKCTNCVQFGKTVCPLHVSSKQLITSAK